VTTAAVAPGGGRRVAPARCGRGRASRGCGRTGTW
jgi:hypothetical protein